MYQTTVEIYSDSPNAAILRHPGRKFPGVLIQGDTLNGLCQGLSRLLEALPKDSSAADEAEALHAHLTELRDHYAATLQQHRVPLPYPA